MLIQIEEMENLILYRGLLLLNPAPVIIAQFLYTRIYLLYNVSVQLFGVIIGQFFFYIFHVMYFCMKIFTDIAILRHSHSVAPKLGIRVFNFVLVTLFVHFADLYLVNVFF